MFGWLSRLFRNAALPIAIKWTLAIGALVTLVMATLGWFLITQQYSIHLREVEGFGKLLVEQLAHSASEPLLADDKFNLEGLVSRQTQSRNVVGAAVVGASGLREKSGAIPPQVPARQDDEPYTWFRSDDQGRRHPVITFVSPIIFKQVQAGVAMISLDREFIDRQQQRTIRIISYATISLIFIAAILSYLLGKRLSRPITALARAGSLGQPTPLLSQQGRHDEIGQVYAHFDRMSAGLLEKRKVEEALSRYVSPVVADKILANLSQPRLTNQEMDGSVLFCDIVGFTELSEDLPPDEVAALLNLYLGAIAQAAHYSRGFVDKFIGDSAMILFGIPEEDPEHAQQAIRCAWLIQGLVRHINQQRLHRGEDPIKLRIGINSGPVLAGNIGTPDRMEYTVVGDTVNLASRLCGIAPADGVMIGETTTSLPGVERMSALHRQKPIRVRGRRNLVTPAIVGTPSREIIPWLQRSVEQILNGPAQCTEDDSVS